MQLPVLIVGAGPTGLNLALSLARRAVPFRILSDAAGPGEHSRAMVVQARTLEFYRQFGFANEAVERGIVAEAIQFREDAGGHVAAVSFKDLGGSISPYPFALAFPQDDHERLLTEKLKESGCTVEWQSKLTAFTEDHGGIRATILSEGRNEEVRAEYLCACDGARSVVRETLKLGFPGGTYDQLFFVADVRIAGAFDRVLHINLGEHILMLMFPVRSSGMQRLIGLVPPELSNRTDLTYEDIRGETERLLNIKVVDVNWFSTYRVHHRVAERFRVGRAFLAGDAAHIHSPAGGQGMNTGIGDAINLGWKLAHVIQRRADSKLLDSYEPERIAFARLLVSTTDRAFTALVGEGVRGKLTRSALIPLFISVAIRFAPTRHAIFRIVSQARIRYPDSPLSEGQAGSVHGGDRLPWVSGGQDNFAPLRSLDWQLHVYGSVESSFERACREIGLDTHVFAWSEAANAAGLQRDAAYLVRPDGYVALALPQQNPAAIREYFRRYGIRMSRDLDFGIGG